MLEAVDLGYAYRSGPEIIRGVPLTAIDPAWWRRQVA